MRLDFLRCRSGVFTELRDFFLVEESPVAGGDFAGKDGADADADEAFDFVAHFIKHEADLALETLSEGHADLLASDGPFVVELLIVNVNVAVFTQPAVFNDV